MKSSPRGPEPCPPPAQAPSDAEALSRPGGCSWSESPVAPGRDLEAILAADSLPVGQEVARALEERALLFDPDRVALRAHALLVRAGRTGASPASCTRSEAAAAVRVALDQLVEEEPGDLEASHERAREDNFSRFAVSLGLDADSLGVARARFHALDLATRRAFLHLVLRGRPFETLSSVEDRQGTLRRAREALELFRCRRPVSTDPPIPSTHPTP